MSPSRIEAMRGALRSFAIDWQGSKSWCKVCSSDWSRGSGEIHQSGCLAAPKCDHDFKAGAGGTRRCCKCGDWDMG